MSMQVPVVGGLTVAGILAVAPFGLPMQQILMGTAFAVLGVVGRAAFEGQKAAEGATSGIPLGKILAWLGSGLIGAPFVTIMYLIVLKMVGVQSDGIVSLGLLFLGFSGPRMVTWLLGTGISLINKKTGLNIPPLASSTPSVEPSLPQEKSAP